MAREYLQAGARAIMQMWRNLEQEEPLDVMKRIKSKLGKQRKALT
ncbi:hypothetical protein [Acetobacter tropicalis]|nr:hypothetical protein [Acetobacter tropicalis]